MMLEVIVTLCFLPECGEQMIDRLRFVFCAALYGNPCPSALVSFHKEPNPYVEDRHLNPYQFLRTILEPQKEPMLKSAPAAAPCCERRITHSD